MITPPRKIYNILFSYSIITIIIAQNFWLYKSIIIMSVSALEYVRFHVPEMKVKT